MIHERIRTYVFDDVEVDVEKVREIIVSKSGGHRLTLAGGKLVYVRSGWYAIFIDSERGWEV